MRPDECKILLRERGDAAAVDWCVAASAQTTCDESPSFCPLRSRMEMWERWGIPARERQLLRADLLGKQSLAPRVALDAVRSRIAGKPGPEGIRGTEALVVLGGRCGSGKTVAATWALSCTGGRYVLACDLAGIGLAIADLTKAKTVVVDQVGVEPISDSGWTLARFLDLVDRRYAELRLTILCTNMSQQAMERRYGPIFSRRLRDDGVFVRVADGAKEPTP